MGPGGHGRAAEISVRGLTERIVRTLETGGFTTSRRVPLVGGTVPDLWLADGQQRTRTLLAVVADILAFEMSSRARGLLPDAAFQREDVVPGRPGKTGPDAPDAEARR